MYTSKLDFYIIFLTIKIVHSNMPSYVTLKFNYSKIIFYNIILIYLLKEVKSRDLKKDFYSQHVQ